MASRSAADRTSNPVRLAPTSPRFVLRRTSAMAIRRTAALAAAIVSGLGAAAPAQAQQAGPAWKPTGNVEIVVGAGAGGENDRIDRAIAHVLTQEHLVDSLTVLNRPGAAQTIAIN